jgi:flavin-binding protein dodecin
VELRLAPIREWLGKKKTVQALSREIIMSDPVYKVVEVVGNSEQSTSKAIENAITRASGSLRHLGWFEVGQIRGSIEEGKANRYQVPLKVGFNLE